MSEWREELLKRIEELDGTVRSDVRLITGYTDEELDELGGFEDGQARGDSSAVENPKADTA